MLGKRVGLQVSNDGDETKGADNIAQEVASAFRLGTDGTVSVERVAAAPATLTPVVKSHILPPPLKPLTYGWMSQSIYSDEPWDAKYEDSNPHIQQARQKLLREGWSLIKFISEASGYIGGVFSHDEIKQVVVAHRGSQNLDSWITDLETVAQGSPGEFVRSALRLADDPYVLALRLKGYRISHTGHSLGGFLAQVCVYWGNRQLSGDNHLYDPDLSAVTFDSPGSVDFIKVMMPNLPSEAAQVNLDQLKIQNYCATPTIVSTYGTHLGTVWHLRGDGADGRLAFVNNHKLDVILERFSVASGYPIAVRQMQDWPRADYSAYTGLEQIIFGVAEAAIKVPFVLLNALYKAIRRVANRPVVVPTLIDRVVASQPGQVAAFFDGTSRQAGNWPVVADAIVASLEHYLSWGEQSVTRLQLFHFDEITQQFLRDVHQASSTSVAGWRAMLEEKYPSTMLTLLAQFTIQQQGEAYSVVMSDSAKNVLVFRRELQAILRARGVISLVKFSEQRQQQLEGKVATLEAGAVNPAIASEYAALRAEITQLQSVATIAGTWLMMRSAAMGGQVVNVISVDDVLKMEKETREAPEDNRAIASAVGKDAFAFNVSPDAPPALAAALYNATRQGVVPQGAAAGTVPERL